MKWKRHKLNIKQVIQHNLECNALRIHVQSRLRLSFYRSIKLTVQLTLRCIKWAIQICKMATIKRNDDDNVVVVVVVVVVLNELNITLNETFLIQIRWINRNRSTHTFTKNSLMHSHTFVTNATFNLSWNAHTLLLQFIMNILIDAFFIHSSAWNLTNFSFMWYYIW